MRKRIKHEENVNFKVIDFCIAYFLEHGYAPTIREITVAVGFGSTQTAKYHMDALYRDGWVESEHRGFPRAFRMSKKAWERAETMKMGESSDAPNVSKES